MDYYSAMKNKDLINFTGKWVVGIETIILNEVTQSQKDMYGIYLILDG